MNSAKSPVSGTDATIVTGVREATPTSPSDSALDAAATMSGRERSAPEAWPAEDEPESELPVAAGVVFGGKYTVERMFAEGGWALCASAVTSTSIKS